MEISTGPYTIYFDESLDAVVMKWNGYATSQEFKDGTELMLKTLIRNNGSKVLADIKEMELIGMEDQKWLESNFLPRAIKRGFKAVAIVKPDNYFNKVAVENVSYKVDKEQLMIRFFDNVEEAKNWLNSF